MDQKETSSSTGQNNSPKQKKLSFFDKIIAFFLGRSSPDEEKKKLIREIGKLLSKQKQKFYNPKKEIVLPGLATFFYEFYKLLGPAKNLVQRSQSSAVLKSIIIESFISEEQLAIRTNLEEKSLRVRIGQVGSKDLVNQVKDEIISFFSAFDTDKVKTINLTYNMVASFLDLVHFDFYFFLKKFDSQLQEDNFFYNPRFEPINGEYIIDDLKEIYDIILALDLNINWDAILETLKTYRNIEVVSRKGWKKGMKQLADIRKSKLLIRIIRHISKDPYYKANPVIHREKIVDQYLTKIKTETELTIQKIIKEKRNTNIEKLTIEVFGTPSISRLKNYTEKANLMYRKKMLGGFIHVTALNFIKAFLLDYFKGGIRDVIDLLLIKGQWTSNVTSQQLSEALHQVFKVSDKLIEFDDALAEEGDLGRKLRNLYYKSDRDKTMMPHVRKALKDINDSAKQIIVETVQNLITMGKHIKYLLNDYTNKRSEYIINWKTIDNKTDGKIKEKLIEVYKRIYNFLKLIQYYAK
jgi:hypothetical protein